MHSFFSSYNRVSKLYAAFVLLYKYICLLLLLLSGRKTVEVAHHLFNKPALIWGTASIFDLETSTFFKSRISRKQDIFIFFSFFANRNIIITVYVDCIEQMVFSCVHMLIEVCVCVRDFWMNFHTCHIHVAYECYFHLLSVGLQQNILSSQCDRQIGKVRSIGLCIAKFMPVNRLVVSAMDV